MAKSFYQENKDKNLKNDNTVANVAYVLKRMDELVAWIKAGGDGELGLVYLDGKAGNPQTITTAKNVPTPIVV